MKPEMEKDDTRTLKKIKPEPGERYNKNPEKD